MSFKMHGVPEAEWAIPVAFYSGRMYMGVPRIMELEKEFNITIPDDQAEKIATVGDAIAYVEANAQ